MSANLLTAAAVEALRREANAITAAVAERVVPHFHAPTDTDRVRADLDGYQAAVADADHILNELYRTEQNHG